MHLSTLRATRSSKRSIQTLLKLRWRLSKTSGVLPTTMCFGGEGPFGGGAGAGVWRSFLSDEYSKSFAKAGGIGIAGQVYQTLLAQQEARARP